MLNHALNKRNVAVLYIVLSSFQLVRIVSTFGKKSIKKKPILSNFFHNSGIKQSLAKNTSLRLDVFVLTCQTSASAQSQ